MLDATGNLTRTKDLPAAITLCNANLEFDDEFQAFKYFELELDVVDVTVLAYMNSKSCANTKGWSSKG